MLEAYKIQGFQISQGQIMLNQFLQDRQILMH